MESEKNMDQLLKLQGLTGGMTESRKLQNKLAYENAVNSLKMQLNDGLSDLDNALLELRNETDYNIAEDMADYDKLYLSYLMDNQDSFADWLLKESDRNSDNFKDMYLSEKEDERFKEELALDREALALNKEKFSHEVENDNKTYNLNASKASKSNADTEYKRRLEEAELRAKFGDFSLLAQIYGWDEETLKKAEGEYKIKGH